MNVSVEYEKLLNLIVESASITGDCVTLRVSICSITAGIGSTWLRDNIGDIHIFRQKKLVINLLISITIIENICYLSKGP